MSCEEKLRQIVFGLEDRLETIRGALEHYAGRLETAESEKNEHLAKHIRETISVFEPDEWR
jgi:predicted component of type VI protein secretion system